MGTGACTFFPVMMLYSTLAPENSFTAYGSGSTQGSLIMAIIWWPIAFLMSVAYFVFISKRYAGKVSVSKDNQGYY